MKFVMLEQEGYLMIMAAKADADGAAGTGKDGCHGIQVDESVSNPL